MTTIVCPTWCRYSQDDHLAELNLTGDGLHVVHESELVQDDMRLHSRTLVDGTPTPGKDEDNGDHEPVMISFSAGHFADFAEMSEHAEAIADLIERGRRGGPHPWLTCPSWCSSRGKRHGPLDFYDGREIQCHSGYPVGDRFLLTVGYDAETGEETERLAGLMRVESADLDGNEDLDLADLALIATQAERVAAWVRGEVEIP